MSLSDFRKDFEPQLPEVLHGAVELVQKQQLPVDGQIQRLFPRTFDQKLVHFSKGKLEPIQMRVGVVLSGGQAPGGHNVIAGLRDALTGPLFGFLGGPSGILESSSIEIKDMDHFRNSGGFDLIGSGRTKIESREQLAQALATVQKMELDGLVIIGGDDSNTNAALLAEYFLENGCSCSVVGVPKTIDGDLKNDYVESSFGFDTATKVYSELIGNLCRDTLSAKKYYHFVRLMGRSASHIALECALQTHANFTIIGEEVQQRNLSLEQLSQLVVDMIEKRAQYGKYYGVILVPEGLIEFIPEMKSLIVELNRDPENLSAKAQESFDSLPEQIQRQLLLDRDPHGNVQVAHIETEKLLMAMCQKLYSGKLNALSHYFGYEGRCSFPSNFDA
nr:diphosphate--fructose-6-phosphate 1-phosphotransferase [Chlamydiota bacterium]